MARFGLEHYSPDYATARQKFLAAAQVAGATLQQYKHPFAKGPQGEDLFVDVAVIGAVNPKQVFINVSGIHGIEGYFGSAVQTAAMRGLDKNSIPSDAAVVFVHAINPYGMAHHTRNNEDNVDLNRNFINFGQEKLPQNPDYDTIHDLLMRNSRSGIAHVIHMLGKLGWSTQRLQAALTGGQYQRPKGMYYGGTKPVWSNQLLRQIVAPYQHADRLTHLDWHTGLGGFAQHEIISSQSKSSAVFQRTQAIWQGHKVTTTNAAENNSASSTLSGECERVYEGWPGDVTAVTHEVGTLGAGLSAQLRTLLAMYRDNLARQLGIGSLGKARQRMLAAFYPTSLEWRANALANGLASFEAGLTSLQPARPDPAAIMTASHRPVQLTY